MTALEAIRESVTRDTIVHLPYDRVVRAELRERSDDWTEGAELEFWGSDPDDNPWRVHMELPPARR